MLIIVVLVVLGLCLGSFVNALVWRLHIQQGVLISKTHKKAVDNSDRHFNHIFGLKAANPYSILNGRSMCPNCHHELAFVDLVPVLSWILLRGKCHYCGKPISWQYPLVELLVPFLFVFSYLAWPLGFSNIGVFSFVLWSVFLICFVALGVYDLRWFLLPDRIVYPLIVLAIVEVIIKASLFGGGWSVINEALWGIVFIAGLFYLLFLASKGMWIGLGDVKLAVVLGLLVGGPLRALLLIFIASTLGSVVALPMLVRGRAKMTSQIPFGPFLLAATILVVLFGNNITDWYNNFFYLR